MHIYIPICILDGGFMGIFMHMLHALFMHIYIHICILDGGFIHAFHDIIMHV